MGVEPAGREMTLPLGVKDENLIVEHIDLERMDIVVRFDVLLVFQQPPHPLEFLFRAVARVLLVFPVRRDAVFRRLVHFPRADLHLERDPCEPMTVVCRDWYILGFGVEI